MARAWNLEYRSSESLRSADYDVSDEQINQRREDFAVVASLLEDGIDLRGRGAADAAYVISLGHLEQLATLQFERKQMVSAASTSGSNSNSPPPELIRGGGNARVLEFKQPTPPSAPQP